MGRTKQTIGIRTRKYLCCNLEQRRVFKTLKTKNKDLALAPQQWLGIQVRHVDALASILHLLVLLAQQPAHVREEEAAFGVVRIRVGFLELVVHSVVSRPLNHGVLEQNLLNTGT